MYFIAVFYCRVWLLSFQPVIVSFNFPAIRPICYIGNLISGLSMFYFVKSCRFPYSHKAIRRLISAVRSFRHIPA